MKRLVLLIVAIVKLFSMALAFAAEWEQLPSLPDNEGFASSFAGVSGGALLVAGGANFPDKRPWDGGTKAWYDDVFALSKPNEKWKPIGKLPQPLGYGVSATHGGSVVCVGGSDSQRHYADAFRLDWRDGQLVTTTLPPLPRPLANSCGAFVGAVLYIAGGQASPTSSETLRSVWRMDFSAKEPKWETIEACPGAGRMLAVAASFDGSFWLISGAELVGGQGGKVERRYLTDAYRYEPGNGWRRIADLPRPVVAAASPAPSDATGFYILGGDDGSQVGFPSDTHLGFSRKILRYSSQASKWIEVGELPAPRVTLPMVKWNESWVAPSGEMRPGIRSPEVWMWTPGKKD